MMGEKVEAEPQEKEDVMISTAFLVIMIKHQWLSPRGWLYRGELVQRGLSGPLRAGTAMYIGLPRRTNQPYSKCGSGLLKSLLCFVTSKKHKQDYKQRGTTTWGEAQ